MGRRAEMATGRKSFLIDGVNSLLSDYGPLGDSGESGVEGVSGVIRRKRFWTVALCLLGFRRRGFGTVSCL